MNKEDIATLLFTELNHIYCDTCRFMNLSSEESERIYGYDGCDGCIRKSMSWEISEEYANRLADKIINNITEDFNK